MSASTVKKIAIIGPESTGKSWLAEQLASHYSTSWVPEYAREYLDTIDRPYVQEDLTEIAKGQLELEGRKMEEAHNFLFCDTNLIVINIWSDHKYGNTDPFILNHLQVEGYDHYLLTNIDLPWEPDPLREHPDMRDHFFKVYHQYMLKHRHPFDLISGVGESRLKNAITAIDSLQD